MNINTEFKIEQLILHLPRDTYFGRNMLSFLNKLPSEEREEAFSYACILSPYWKGITIGQRQLIFKEEPIERINEEGERLFELLTRMIILQKEEKSAVSLWRLINQDSILIMEEKLEIRQELREAVVRWAILSPDFPSYTYSPNSLKIKNKVYRSEEDYFNGIGENKVKIRALLKTCPNYRLFLSRFLNELMALPDKESQACLLCYTAIHINQNMDRLLMKYQDCSFGAIKNKELQTAWMHPQMKIHAKIEGISYAFGEESSLFYAAYRMLDVMDERKTESVLANVISNLILIDQGAY